MPTREQYEQAIALAQQRGLTAAADVLIKRAARDLTGEGSFMEKVGAGFQDLYVGGKQALGLADRDEVDEQMRLSDQAAGDSLGGHLTRAIPAGLIGMAIPGGGTLAGATAIGAGLGALQPTADENVLAGKATQALVGGATGGVGQQVIGRALPAAVRAASGAVGSVGGRLTQGGRQRIAEQAFRDSLDDPVAAELQLQRYAGTRQQPYPPGMSGAPSTTGVALAAGRAPGAPVPNQRMLAAERYTREAGGELGNPFREVSEQAGQARWNFLEGELGGDVARLAQAADDVYANFIRGARMVRPFDPRNALGAEIAVAAQNTTNRAIRAEFERIAEQHALAVSRGDVQSLHELRMTAFDDALSRMYASDSRAAGIMRNAIERFKSTFDDEMDRALGPGRQWSRFRDEYSLAARARDQARAGNQAIGQLETNIETPSGVPQLTGARRQLGRMAAERDDFGNYAQSPDARDALTAVRREIGEELLPYSTGPRGTATAQNLAPGDRVLAQARAAQGRDNSTPFLVGAALGEPLSVATALGARRVIDRQTIDIAQRLVQLYADPNQALAVLSRMNLPPQAAQSVAQLILQNARRLGPPAGRALSSTLAAMEAQQQ